MATNIVVPELGESVVEARVAKWLKKQGDQVAAGDALVELETEKIDLEVSADRAGVLADIKHQEGADVKVGEVLAVLEESTTGASAQAPAAVPEVPGVPNVPKGDVPKAVASSSDKKATPTAKNAARALDVKIDAVATSSGRVTKQDVLKAAAPAAEKPAAPVTKPQTPSPRPLLVRAARRASACRSAGQPSLGVLSRPSTPLPC